MFSIEQTLFQEIYLSLKYSTAMNNKTIATTKNDVEKTFKNTC